MKEQKVTIENPFIAGFMFASAVITVLVFISLLYTWGGKKISPDDVRASCETHHGVARTENLEWRLAQNGSLAIVCRDGFYTTRP